jgi:UDP-glucose 4-epimerase
MRVLVTGAAGFVGYAVAALLVERGYEVTGLTRSGTSALPEGVQRLKGDLCTPETLPSRSFRASVILTCVSAAQSSCGSSVFL